MPKMKNLTFFLILLWGIFLISCKNNSKTVVYEIKKSAIADQAMVVSAHPAATQVGLEILKKGGNAVDAAIAVQFALAVVYPVAGNIGGGGFMVVRTHDGRTAALDFREKAPLLATETMYQDSAGKVVEGLSVKGHLAAGVPGTVDGMFKAHEKFGKLSMPELLEPAIALAKDGFKLTEDQANGLNRGRDNFVKYNTTLPVFVKEEAWKPGELLLQPDLAHTLQLIKEQGEAGFYQGEIAGKIVAEMKAGGGLISQEDLVAYESQWREPIVNKYKNYSLIGMPPPSSGGVALAQLMEMIEPFDIAKFGFHSKEAIHLMVEAERRVYADRSQHLGDADFYPVPLTALMAPQYLQSRMDNFDPDSATASEFIKAGETPMVESEETTHFSIVDQEGNAVAVTTTINGGYGCYTVVAGAGFLLNNEMDDFSVKPGEKNMYGLIGAEANKIEPGKRMLSSMTPTIVLKDDKLYMVVGTPGGSTIITSVFQTIVNVLEFGMDMPSAVAAQRFHHQWIPDGIMVEKGAIAPEIRSALELMGHQLIERDGIGRVDAIRIRPDGKLEGGADPRGDDHAQGF